MKGHLILCKKCVCALRSLSNKVLHYDLLTLSSVLHQEECQAEKRKRLEYRQCKKHTGTSMHITKTQRCMNTP